MKILTFNDKEIVKDILLKNEVVAFPTETVFGLGCISTSKDAFDKLVKVKLRAPDKPFTLMCSSLDQVKDYVEFSPKSLRIAEKFMPGSITLLLPVKRNVPEYITLNSEFIGIRIPDIKELCDLILYVGCPLLVPSANKAGEPPALSTEEVIKIFDGEVEAVIKGTCDKNIPSTIVKIDKNNVITLIRKGPIAFEDILKEGE